jgi:hypothetical protein
MVRSLSILQMHLIPRNAGLFSSGTVRHKGGRYI